MTKKTIYTNEEKQFIINNHQQMSYKELSKYLNKTIGSIQWFLHINKLIHNYDLTGKTFGRLFVIKQVGTNKHRDVLYQCQCSCINKTIKIISDDSLNSGKVVSCGCYRKEQVHKGLYKGTKDISGHYFSQLLFGAKSRNLEFAITILYIQELLEKQNYRCALSGLSIKGSKNPNSKHTSTYSEQTASLDRIDSSKGYIEGNVQWVHKDTNFMKQEYSQEYFIQMCRNVVNYQDKKLEINL